MPRTVFKNVRLVNENTIQECDVRIENNRIERIGGSLPLEKNDTIIEGNGRYLLPGMIDDQVHFREPGLTHKGSIATESAAAIAGGITSFMEMPNVKPSTTTLEALEHKYNLGYESARANYAFYLGATEDNIDEIKRLDPSKHCGVKVFMGASTGDLLVEKPDALDRIFKESPTLIVTHCEHGAVIERNTAELRKTKPVFEINDHPILRDTEACYASSSYAVELAKKHNSQLHVLHITTKKELELFAPGPVEGKHITAEACVHHLWFSKNDYARLGNLIKCNPAIKAESDRDAILEAVKSGRIDIIATDHAPHTFEEKSVPFEQAPAGLPLVQHALPTLLDHVQSGRLTLKQVVEKMAHNPARRYRIQERGFVREGYFADLVLVDLAQTSDVTEESLRYHCGWSPFLGHTFRSKIYGTWVNGVHVYDGQNVLPETEPAMRLVFGL